MHTSEAPVRLSIAQVLACGALIVTTSMGIRHGFGLWLAPITGDRGWTREAFALAMAFQNLAWGLSGPLTGMVADRIGAFRVLLTASVLYAAGLLVMASASQPLWFTLGTGLLIGIAQSGCTFAVVYGVIGRNVPAQKRSWAMGVTAAAGSFGQFLMMPVENALISRLGWQPALWVLAGTALLILPLAFGLREPAMATAPQAHRQSVGAALREAFGDRSFVFLTVGYFVCGFQLMFVGIHLPSFLKDANLASAVATTALALIGLFNIFGTYGAGLLGQRLAKRHVLSTIYLLRSVVIVVFIALPVTPMSVYLFAAVMGLLWLSTVPLTNALVAQIFGVQHLSMLSGFVFLSHQLGSFLGIWLGGRLYDATGSYTTMWWLAVALGVFAALVNQPVRETAIERPLAPA